MGSTLLPCCERRETEVQPDIPLSSQSPKRSRNQNKASQANNESTNKDVKSEQAPVTVNSNSINTADKREKQEIYTNMNESIDQIRISNTENLDNHDPHSNNDEFYDKNRISINPTTPTTQEPHTSSIEHLRSAKGETWQTPSPDPQEQQLEQGEIIITDEFLISIRIEFLEVTYKLCDDFGNIFKPYLEIHMDDVPPMRINVFKPEDKDKLNSSSISTGGGSGSLDLSMNDINNSIINTVSSITPSKNSKFSNNGKEGKMYNFRSVILNK